ncbi:MAG: S8 family serine peptidase [Dokdonella sp.]
MRQLVRVNMLASAVGVALFGIGFSMSAQAATGQRADAVAATTVAVEASSVGRYIVTFAEPGLLHYNGDVSGLSATAPSAVGSRKLDSTSAAARSYSRYLDAQRSAHVDAIEHALGRTLTIKHTYGVNTNGISAEMSQGEATAVAALPGIASVRAVHTYNLDTFRGPKFIGADKIWDGSATPTLTATKGEGIKVGIIDTGTNSTHPSFANDPTCGFSEATPKLHAVDCNFSAAGVCNGPQPEAQTSGHGVHTSSTVGGNTIDNTAVPAPQLPDGITMSGVAPCATVYSYRVEQADGSLSGDAITAAIESLAIDQIDVANYSIGVSCSNGTPWSDEDRLFLDSVNADVFVAASAGNTRSSCTNPVGGVSHMGPWLMTVAASTQDQQLGQAEVSLTAPGTPPAEFQNVGVTTGDGVPASEAPNLTNSPLRADPDNIAGCTDTGGFPAHYFDGSIAVVRRGATPPSTTACTFSEKINNAAAAGALVVLIANNKNDAQAMSTPGTTIGGFKINSLQVSDDLIAFINANQVLPNADVIFADGFDGALAPGVLANFTVETTIVSQLGDVLAAFSERGPTPTGYDDLTKPDITAPGVSIYAAGRPADGNYLIESGTSMSSPHTAGAAALVRAVRPDWTVEEVKSAMQSTATNATGVQEDATTPWTVDQVGSGRVDLTKATLAGLTLDETYANFVAADPAVGTVAMKDLNIASVRNSSCDTTCTWTRTVKNQLSTSGSWNTTATATDFGLTVSPSSFTLAPGATQVLTITATPTGTLSAEAFGEVNLVEASGQSPDQHITAAVKSGGGSTGGGGGVTCANGACVFQVDVLASNFSGFGCNSYCGLVWLNRFTPDAADYPITITSVSTIFGNGTGWNHTGDNINVYVYQDDDTDPSNGATLVGSHVGYTMGAPANSFVTINLTTPITVNGPGEILIALTNPNGDIGTRPAAADAGPFAGRSWVALYDDTVAGIAPDLSGVGLQLNTDASPGFVGNWLIRATGTNAAGQPLELNSGNHVILKK